MHSPVGAAQPKPVDWARVIALVGGQTLVQCGGYALLIAMVWSAVQRGGAGAVTLITLSATVPRALALLFGGAITDSAGPRAVLLRTTSGRTIVLAAGAVVAASTHQLWPLMLIACADGTLLGLGGPASSGLMPRLALKDHLARANSLYATSLRLAPVIGAPLGAWLISAGPLWQVMAIAAATSAVWFGAVAYVTRGMARPEQRPGTSMLRRTTAGLQLLKDNRRLRWLFTTSLCLDLAFNWPAEVALPLLAAERDWGPQAVGLVLAAFSAGALVSSALGALLAHRIPLFVRLVISSGLLACGILAMALMPTVTSLVAVACVVGTVSGFNGPALMTAYQQAAPPSRMGAAMSTLSLTGIGAGPVSIAVFGSIALGLGVQTTWLLCGIVAAFAPVAAVAALRAPEQNEVAVGAEDVAERPGEHVR